jgi:hypothetical protein
MSRLEKLRAVSKKYGVHAIAKKINDDGNACGISEEEFTAPVSRSRTAKATRKRSPGFTRRTSICAKRIN